MFAKNFAVAYVPKWVVYSDTTTNATLLCVWALSSSLDFYGFWQLFEFVKRLCTFMRILARPGQASWRQLIFHATKYNSCALLLLLLFTCVIFFFFYFGYCCWYFVKFTIGLKPCILINSAGTVVTSADCKSWKEWESVVTRKNCFYIETLKYVNKCM